MINLVNLSTTIVCVGMKRTFLDKFREEVECVLLYFFLMKSVVIIDDMMNGNIPKGALYSI